jgi:hypothetical protein
VGGDCDDADASVNPGANEVCNGKDDNCNGLVDEFCLQRYYYRDVDQDGYGSTTDSIYSGIQPPGYVLVSGDCNDWDPSIHPWAIEICDWKDNNCDGRVDENCRVYYRDADGDGYGRYDISISANTPPAGYVTIGGDCNDADAAVHPGATEIINGKDDNCNGMIDEDFFTGTRSADTDATMKNKDIRKADAQPKEFNIVVSPNPSMHVFNVYIMGDPGEGKVSLGVFDYLGRLIESKDNLMIGQVIKLGVGYSNGVYVLEAVQNKNRKTIKVIKQ